MLGYLILVAGIASSVHAIGPVGCSFTAKGGLAPVPPPLCKNSLGGLHMICATSTWAAAEQACAQRNLRLAHITDDNVMFAQDLLQYCSLGENAWIAAYSGLNAEPAMMLNKDAVVVRGNYAYNGELMQPICQDIPVETIVTSLTTAITVSTGTQYTFTTTTTTVYRHHRHEKTPNQPIQKAQIGKKECPQNRQCRRPNQTSCNCCSDACSVGFDGLHVVYGEMMSFGEARAACRRHGWHLADYLSGMTFGLMANLVEQCNLDPLDVKLWIRSFEGVASADCLAVSIQNGLFNVGFGISDAFCSYSPAFGSFVALCQEQPPLLTGLGPFEGRVTTTTQSDYSTSFINTPATTETITFTVTRRHRRVCTTSISTSDSTSDSTSSDSNEDESFW